MTLTTASTAASATERTALEDCVGALQFILAFYEPGQRTLDTEAWKVACQSGVAAYLRGAAEAGWPTIPYRADNGAVYRERPLKPRPNPRVHHGAKLADGSLA